MRSFKIGQEFGKLCRKQNMAFFAIFDFFNFSVFRIFRQEFLPIPLGETPLKRKFNSWAIERHQKN
jgi:hypothetical protein